MPQEAVSWKASWHAGDLRVALFPSKHSRVRIPSPALTAKDKTLRPPIGGRRACKSLTRKERTLEPKPDRTALSLVPSQLLRISLVQGAQITLVSHFILEVHEASFGAPAQADPRAALEDSNLSRQVLRLTSATLGFYQYTAGESIPWLQARGIRFA